MTEAPDSDQPLVEAGRYRRLNIARERSLVVAALELPFWIERERNDWVLFVRAADLESVRPELAAFEVEEKQRPPRRAFLPDEKIPTFSLYVATWLLGGVFFAQLYSPGPWIEQGSADGAAILHGEWWRTITALTLHADGSHIIANLVTGLLFAFFVISRLGPGFAWLAILVSGALGNALNSWGYRGEEHISIGASTACFGALGILVGAELFSRWRDHEERSRWQLILPLGAGLGLLAYLGAGDGGKTIDFMAHGWGFAAGFVEGILTQALRVKERASRRLQLAAGGTTLGLLTWAWTRALLA
jgi:membrane associated rhomboid family serine protease